jgi:small subunit ribosomal protein S13
MIRISGVTLQDKKQIRFALSLVKGIGKSNVKKLLDKLSIPHTKHVDELTEEEILGIRTEIESSYVVEENLQRDVKINIDRLKRIGSWRGLRHKAGMPTRGQTTKTNSRTVRGNVRKTAGSGKIKSEGKT